MKRRLLFILCAAVLVAVSAAVLWFCFHEPADTIAYYNEYTGVSFRETLTQEEAAHVAQILQNSSSEDTASSVPSCGFHRRVYICVDGAKYYLALDGCGIVFAQSDLSYRGISQEQRSYLDQLFAAYGGTFPCV